MTAQRAAAFALCLVASACATTAVPKAGGWASLFDGHSTAGWHNVGKTTLDPRWQVVDGVLTLAAAGGGDIVSAAQFGDFELEWEWQLAAGGNSGLFYRAVDREPIWHYAAEYQLLDDAGAEDRFVASHRAGSVYDLVAAQGAHLRPVDAFNASRVVACGAHVSQWLNGRQVAAYEQGSDDWNRRLAASKFAALPEFAAAPRGHIGFQDHGAVLRVRAVRIRELRDCAPD